MRRRCVRPSVLIVAGALLLADAGAHARVAGAGLGALRALQQDQLAAQLRELERAAPTPPSSARSARCRDAAGAIAFAGARARATRRRRRARPHRDPAHRLRRRRRAGHRRGGPAQGPGPLPGTPLPGRARDGGDRRPPHDLRRAVPPHRPAAPRRPDRREMPYGRFTYRVERTRIVDPDDALGDAPRRLRPARAVRLPSAVLAPRSGSSCSPRLDRDAATAGQTRRQAERAGAR